MTIQSPKIIVEMLQNGGKYPGDPPMRLIYEYDNSHTHKVFACFLLPEHDDTLSSPYVMNPKLLLKDGELTEEGTAFLAANC